MKAIAHPPIRSIISQISEIESLTAKEFQKRCAAVGLNIPKATTLSTLRAYHASLIFGARTNPTLILA